MKIAECGFVYMITSPNGRIYVGSSIDIDRRFRYYKNTLAKLQIKLNRSFKKYGVENHVFEVVWAGLEIDMFKYETLIGWGFDVLEPENLNLKLPKLGNIYNSFSEETKLKMSNSAKNKIVSIETRNKLSFIGKGRKQSIEHIKKRVNSFNGFKHSKESKIKMSDKANGRARSEETKLKIAKNSKNKKLIYQFDLDMNFIKEWDSISEANKILKINITSICRCCKKKLKTAGGFKWEYKN